MYVHVYVNVLCICVTKRAKEVKDREREGTDSPLV